MKVGSEWRKPSIVPFGKSNFIPHAKGKPKPMSPHIKRGHFKHCNTSVQLKGIQAFVSSKSFGFALAILHFLFASSSHGALHSFSSTIAKLGPCFIMVSEPGMAWPWWLLGA